jgi:hypothetical protein
MSFKAPVKDMLFTMTHVAGLEQVAQLPGFEEAGLEPRLALAKRLSSLRKAAGRVFSIPPNLAVPACPS